MYILIGRTPDYAWSLTSAGHDVRDVYAEQLCEPDNVAADPRLDALHLQGPVPRHDQLQRGHAGDHPAHYNVTVHGPVFATATVGGQPYALSRRRSTFGRDALNLAALKDMTEGKAGTPPSLLAHRQRVRLHLQLGLRVAHGDGVLLLRTTAEARARASIGACRRSAPANTSGRASSPRSGIPHDVTGPDGLLLNWNNRSAPGFMHGDDEPYGSVQRVEMFNRFPAQVQITDNVGIMNRAATEDVRSPVWPIDQPGAPHRHGPERPRSAGRRSARRLGRPRRPAPRCRRRRDLRRGRPGDHGRGLAADRERGDVAGVRRARRRPGQRPQPRRPRGRVLRGQGSPHPARRPGRRSVQPLLLRRRRRWRRAATRSGRRFTRPPTLTATQLASGRPGPVAQAREPAPASSRACCRTPFPFTNRPTFQQVLEFEH